MKRFGKEVVDVNRAVTGAVSCAAGMVTLAIGGEHLMDALAPFAQQPDTDIAEMASPQLARSVFELGVALSATVFGQFQIVLAVHQSEPENT